MKITDKNIFEFTEEDFETFDELDKIRMNWIWVSMRIGLLQGLKNRTEDDEELLIESHKELKEIEASWEKYNIDNPLED